MIERLILKLDSIEAIEIDERANLKEIYHQNEMQLLILQTIMIINVNLESRDLDLNQRYAHLIEISSSKLHFQYFVRQEILEKVYIDKKDSKTNVNVKFSNKFLPATLPNVGKIIDEKMRINESSESKLPSDVRQLQPLCRKLNKGQTPISFCSETVIV